MGQERGRVAPCLGGVLSVALVFVTVFLCRAAYTVDNAPAGPVAGPYSGKTAGDIQKEESGEKTSKGRDEGNLPGVPGMGAILKMLLWVGVVVVLIYGSVYLIRRYIPSARNMFGNGVLKVVGKTYISSKQSILLVKVGSKFVMVGVTGTAMSPLAEVSDPDEARKITEELAAQSGHSIADSFRKSLSREGNAYTEKDEPSRSVEEPQNVELGDIRQELDAVTQKMSWWRRQSNA